MRLTQKLLSFIHRVFDKDPVQFLALRIQYDGGLTWQVSDGVLATTVTGGTGQDLAISLAQYTLDELANFIGTQPGYSIDYVDRSELAQLSALVLIDGAGDIDTSNGDHLYGYQSPLWSYMEAQSSELEQAEAQIGEMLNQMSTVTAADIWLDELGDYYGVPRLQGELDASYGPRIIAEVLRPRSNNVALEMAITAYTGQPTTVSDVIEYGPTFPLYNGAVQRDASRHYNASAEPIYGLFDVVYSYDLLNGSDQSAFAQTVIGIINRYRAAGTHMRQLALLLDGSGLSDMLTAPTDGGGLQFAIASALADTLTTAADGTLLMAASIGAFADTLNAANDDTASSVTRYAYTYNSVRHYNSAILRQGGVVDIYPDEGEVLDLTLPTLDSRITFTRASTKTYVGSDGLLHTAAVNECPLEYDPVSLSPIGRSFWEARTNLISVANPGGSGWSTAGAGATITQNASAAPDGTTTMTRIASSGGNSSAGRYRVSVAVLTVGQVVTYSVFVRYVSGAASVSLSLEGNAFTSTTKAVFNPQTGTLTSSQGVSATTIQNYGNGVFRISITAAALAAGACNVTVYSGTTSVMAVDAWGAQFESAATPGPYIDTAGAQVTRSTDVATVNDLSLLRFSTTQGTLYVEGYSPYLGSTGFPGLPSFINSGDSERLGFYIGDSSDDKIRFGCITADTVNRTTAFGSALTGGGLYKVAAGFDVSSVSAAMNGAALVSNFALTSGLPSLNMFRVSGFNSPPNAVVRRVRYLPTRLPDAQLALLAA